MWWIAHAFLFVTQSLYVMFEKWHWICCKPQRKQQPWSPVMKKSLIYSPKALKCCFMFKVSSTQGIKADFFASSISLVWENGGQQPWLLIGREQVLANQWSLESKGSVLACCDICTVNPSNHWFLLSINGNSLSF